MKLTSYQVDKIREFAQENDIDANELIRRTKMYFEPVKVEVFHREVMNEARSIASTMNRSITTQTAAQVINSRDAAIHHSKSMKNYNNS